MFYIAGLELLPYANRREILRSKKQ